MGWFDNLQRCLILVGTLLAAVFLIKFAIDFSRGSNLLLAVPFWALVVASLVSVAANLFVGDRNPASPAKKFQARFLAAIPLGFFVSSLDCTGLAGLGCSPHCTFVKLVLIPLIAVACAVYFFTGSRLMLIVITAILFLPLYPHCICYNMGNAWWIDQIGASPVCYSWGFMVSLIAVSALRAGARVWLSLVVCGAVITGATVFFISHHYFKFPW